MGLDTFIIIVMLIIKRQEEGRNVCGRMCEYQIQIPLEKVGTLYRMHRC